ncbi:MAG: glutamate synthase subunit alpha, partial [Vicinamibacterales bacterium]
MDREPGCPPPQGLYDPSHEKDACGVGFVVNVKGVRSHSIVEQALQLLVNLLHRGACGCEVNTGDGAGIIIQMPDRFLRKAARDLGITLPPAGEYGAGCIFLPRDPSARATIEALVEKIVHEEGQTLLGWRDLPVDDRLVGASAVAVEPYFKQIFIGQGADLQGADLKVSATKAADSGAVPTFRSANSAFERKLYVIRKRIEHAVDRLPISIADRKYFYIPSLSANTLIYKGMLIADQIEGTFPDLSDPDVESALALVHQRFSTNTFPSWPLAHPYRLVAHNGEINTLTGNINWMRAREGLLQSDALGDDLQKVLPVIREGGSDSATFDNVLEFLVMNGRSLPHAMLMMIPEPWSGDETMRPELKAFYEYHSSLMEPWDGPASIAFTDGTVIGAILDRNGLRPSRYYVTKDGYVIAASEAGVLHVDPANILSKGRLQPG